VEGRKKREDTVGNLIISVGENKRKSRKKREKRAFGRREKMRVFLIITSIRNWRIICGRIFI
jgi:hypothetical protein